METSPQSIIPADLDKIQVRDNNNKIIGRVGMLVTLYLEEPHNKHLRMEVAQCIEDYYSLLKPHLKLVASEEFGVRKLSNYILPAITDLVSPLDENDSFELMMTGANSVKETSPYNIDALLDFKPNYKDIGYLRATFPFAFLEQQESGFFQQWVHDWCKRLSPYHGYAGLGLINSMEYDTARRNERLFYPLIQRFPGLEIDIPLSHSRHCDEGLKSVNWLTILSDSFLQKLGGKTILKNQLGNEFPFYDYPGGTIIQAGPHPQIGDLEKNNIPRHYQQVYRLVQSVQAEYPDIIMDTPEDVNGLEFTQQWLHRFG